MRRRELALAATSSQSHRPVATQTATPIQTISVSSQSFTNRVMALCLQMPILPLGSNFLSTLSANYYPWFANIQKSTGSQIANSNLIEHLDRQLSFLCETKHQLMPLCS